MIYGHPIYKTATSPPAYLHFMTSQNAWALSGDYRSLPAPPFPAPAIPPASWRTAGAHASSPDRRTCHPVETRPLFWFAGQKPLRCWTTTAMGQRVPLRQVASGRTLPAVKWEGPHVPPSLSLRRACARTMMTRARATTTGSARSALRASRATSLTATRATARRPHAHPHHLPRAAAVESRDESPPSLALCVE